MAPCQRIILGITGATGMLYVPAFLKLLSQCSLEVHGIVSESGSSVLRIELGIAKEALPLVSHWFAPEDFSAPPASGSAPYDAMVILPCTVGSLAAIASGFCGNLIHRCADVTLKERRPLILAVRETPLNRTHLKNMLTVNDAGAILCPPMPSFYTKPQNLEEMALSYAARICDLLEIPVAPGTIKRWQGV